MMGHEGLGGYEAVGMFVFWGTVIVFAVLLVVVCWAWVSTVSSFGPLKPQFQKQWFGLSDKASRERRNMFVRIPFTKLAFMCYCERRRAWKRRDYMLAPKIGVLPKLTEEEPVIGYRGEGFDDQS